MSRSLLKIIQLFSLIIFSLILILQPSLANSQNPSYHAPIGVMRDHVHGKNELMFSYRQKRMNMRHTYQGKNKVSSDKVRQDYMMAPDQMNMAMHMFGGMYGVTDNFTLSSMIKIIDKEMSSINRSNKVNHRNIEGFGDTMINGSYQFYKTKADRAQINIAISLPTGDIKQNHNGTRLGYKMQNGSGSYELNPGLSLVKKFAHNYSIGGQINSIFRLNQNNNGYKLGDSYNFTSWLARDLTQNFSASTRLDYTISDGIDGIDDDLNVMMAPINETFMGKSKILNLSFGLNFIATQGYLQGHRIAFEYGFPLYQDLGGYQLGFNQMVTLGWQKTF